jgi:aspartate/tyrosine/aromatic aminotransferase
MSVGFQRTTWRYIPEARTLHNHCCEKLKSWNENVVLRPEGDLTPQQNVCQLLFPLPHRYVMANRIQEFVLEHSGSGALTVVTKCILCTVKKRQAHFPAQFHYSADSNSGCVQ